ncbi:MAG: hypothetical protein K2X44_08145 [Magnetospirillum sp.]|nr:hypothetical protein [Magnetospirillum sp.]
MRWVAAAFAGCLLATLPATLVPQSENPSYVRSERLNYEAFSPLGPAHRHLVIGSCEVAIPTVANDLDKPGAPARNVTTAWFGNIANFVLRNEYKGAGQSAFYDFSAPNTDMAQHTALLYQALQVPGLQSVLYVNGLSLGHAVPPDETLEVVAVLEALERDYPVAADSVRAYRALQMARPAFAEGERRFGADWRSHIRPVTATFEAPGAVTLDLNERAPPPGADWKALVQFNLVAAKKLAVTLAGGPVSLANLALSQLGFDQRRRDEDVRKELAWAGRFYDRPQNHGPIKPMRGSKYLDEEEEFNHRWLVMAAELLKAKGARLVIYGQPMLVLPRDEYRDGFTPRYVDRAAQWLAAYDPVIIDQTWAHDLTNRDFAIHCPADKPECVAGEFQQNGYYPTIIGRYKQVHLLIDAMRERGLLQADHRSGRPAWRQIESVTAMPQCIEYEGDPMRCRP